MITYLLMYGIMYYTDVQILKVGLMLTNAQLIEMCFLIDSEMVNRNVKPNHNVKKI